MSQGLSFTNIAELLPNMLHHELQQQQCWHQAVEAVSSQIAAMMTSTVDVTEHFKMQAPSQHVQSQIQLQHSNRQVYYICQWAGRSGMGTNLEHLGQGSSALVPNVVGAQVECVYPRIP